jgi:hypothetical protein
MVTASLLIPAPAGVAGEEHAVVDRDGSTPMNKGGQKTHPEDATEAHFYRTVARSYAGELQRQEQRKKLVTSIAFAVTSSFFVGLIVLGYLTRG